VPAAASAPAASDRPDRRAGSQLVWLAAYRAAAAIAQGVHGCLQAVQTTVSAMLCAR
jgi:hypothetical protein